MSTELKATKVQKIHGLYYLSITIALIVSLLTKEILVFLGVYFGLILLDMVFKQMQILYYVPEKVPSKEEKSDHSEMMSTPDQHPSRKAVMDPIQKQVRIAVANLIVLGVILTLALEVFIIFEIVMVLALGLTIWQIKRGKVEIAVEIQKKNRLEWVDQFRGLVALFLIISVITWKLSGDFYDGTNIGNPEFPPIGPTYLNHGWKYAEWADWPNMITIIDIGQQILMFIVGFVGALAYYKHLQREGEFSAFLHVIRRFYALLFFALLVSNLFGGDIDMADWNMVSTFWTGTFSNLAWGSLFGLLMVIFLKRKPDQRFIAVIGIFIVYSVLFSIDSVHDWSWSYGGQVYFEVPWNTINHIAIAIAGTCTYDWYQNAAEKGDPDGGWRDRILLVGTLSFVFTWLVDFVEPAEHHDATTALSLMAIATSMFILFIFYSFDKVGFKISPLSSYGKNILIMFLMAGVWDSVFLDSVYPYDDLVGNPWLSLVMVGIIPLFVQWIAAWIMERNHLIMKF